MKLLGKCSGEKKNKTTQKLLYSLETKCFDCEEVWRDGQVWRDTGRQHTVLPRLLILDEADWSWTPVQFFLACVLKDNDFTSLILILLLWKMVVVTPSEIHWGD